MRCLFFSTLALLFAWPATAQLSEPNERGVTFSHMHVVVADLELHKKLWVELFDAVIVEKEGYTAARIPGALIFFRTAEPTAPSDSTVLDHFGLDVQNLSAVLTKWRALGFEVDAEDTGEDSSHEAYITMPGGTRLSLGQNPDLNEVARMGHVHFSARDRDELLGWYVEVFGAFETDKNNSETSGKIPGSGLTFTEVAGSKLPTEGTAIDHIGFEIAQWDDFIEMLKSKDVEFEFGPVHIESLDLWVAFFSDPGGALVEVSHGLDNF